MLEGAEDLTVRGLKLERQRRVFRDVIETAYGLGPLQCIVEGLHSF